jgi:acyl carrier protein
MNDHIETLAAWVRARHAEDDVVVECDGDTDLFGSGILDSLGFIALVALVEELSGAPIDLDEVDIDELHTIRAIVQRFLTPAGHRNVSQ